MKNFKYCMALVGAIAVAGTVIAADAAKVNLNLTMLTKVNPNALALWDATNKAQDDNGDVDPKKLNAAAWAKLADMGKAIEEGAQSLATSTAVMAAAPGAKLQDETNPGASKAADVQRYLDAKPAEFRKFAAALQKSGAGIVEAATKHDAKKLNDLSNSMDEVCESCHTVFWYPQQGKAK